MFFSRHILKTKISLEDIPYPKKQKQLPKIMNVTDVQKLLETSVNIKYKTIFLIAYAAGLPYSPEKML